ncbi:MAG: response regulator [Lachnospiraceae bacterium]|nr:response regulator [Lachnospiraceae bacterium]
MFDKKRLLTLSELNLQDKIEQMSDDQVSIYIQKMNYFIDTYPSKEYSIKEALAAHDTGKISKNLVSVWDMLDKLYAENLSQRCLELVNNAKDFGIDKLEADLTALFTDASALSISMQMVQQVTEPIASVEEKVDAGREYKILAVDDASFFLGALKSFLDGTQYKVTCLTSGTTALRYLANNTPDLFILDIEMPDMDGYELAQKIKEKGLTAPIIFLTGNANKEYVAKAIKVGGVDFIVKPIDKKRVMEKLKQHL